jgi:hypothetical protein
MRHFIYLLLIILVPGVTVLGKTDKKDTQKEITKEKAKGDTIITSSLVDGLKFRSIGPAWCSGRICRSGSKSEKSKRILCSGGQRQCMENHQ